MDVKIEESWREKLEGEFTKPYFQELVNFVRSEYKSKTVYPHPSQIFNAFALCPIPKVKVVIVGQDPYHGKGQANGLSFAVNSGVQIPPSLQNIFKEIESDMGYKPLYDGDLSRWAKQGVLLLNATLTVQANMAGSHQNRGWEQFTDAVLHVLNESRDNIVFILWGNYARKKGEFLDRNRHLVLESPHPSPFAARHGFFGSKPFSKCNQYLAQKGIEEIDWK